MFFSYYCFLLFLYLVSFFNCDVLSVVSTISRSQSYLFRKDAFLYIYICTLSKQTSFIRSQYSNIDLFDFRFHKYLIFNYAIVYPLAVIVAFCSSVSAAFVLALNLRVIVFKPAVALS